LPRNWGYFYMKACGYALNGKNGAAIKALEQLVEIGRFFNIETEKDLDGLRKLDAFKALMVKLQEKKKPVINSSGAFVLKERDLFPEGIAYDPGEKAFFLSSAVKCKIVKIDRNGKCSDFTRSRQDGLLPTYGMRVDPQRRVLWVCSDFAYPRANIKKELFGTSGVFKYNLDTGKLIKKYMLPQKEEHMLNDVALAPDGTVYFSDSHVPGVYRIDSKTDKIKLFASLSNYGYPNGITYSPDTRKLYVSCSYYVVVVDVETGKVSELAHPENMYATGFDGLYYYKGSLLGIQIFTKPARVVRL
ncbi:MAG: SMP-30/gluconolactonase/LRE family protein, partial [bacterium]|nr:SMP-30/gluconolactonase/LRE family protein [bacterium]